MMVATHAEIVLRQLNEMAVSDRGTSGGLTQFPRTALLVRVKPLKANEIQGNGSQVAGVCDNLSRPLTNR